MRSGSQPTGQAEDEPDEPGDGEPAERARTRSCRG